MRIHLQRVMSLLNRLVKLPCKVKLHRQAMADSGGSRSAIQGAFRNRQSFLGLPERAEIKSIEGVGSGISWIQGEGLLKMLSGGRPISIVSEADVSQRNVSFREMVVDLQRLDSRGLRFRHCQARRNHMEKRQVGVSVSQTCVSQRISWVLVESLPETFNGFLQTFWVPFVPVVASLQVKPIRFGVFGVAFRQSLLLIAGQLQLQLLRNFPGKITLEKKNVLRLAVVLATPELRAGRNIHQFDPDDQRAPVLQQSPRDHSANVQIAPGLLGIGLFSFV